jgi:23S rRNA pseudouridine2457 synthase
MTQFTDREQRPTLSQFIPIPNLYAAGRLDLDSEGLLLLTDHGGLNARLTQPKFAHPRTYWAQVERLPDEAALEQLRRGVPLNDGMTLPAQAELLDGEPLVNGLPLPERSMPIRYRKNVPTAWIALTLTEGRNRQVRRMTAAVGHPTLRLVRKQIGTGAAAITLEGLSESEWAWVDEAKIAALWRGFRRKG